LVKNGYQVNSLGWDRTGKLPKSESRDKFSINRLRIKAKFGNGLMNLPALLAWQIGLMVWLLKKRKNYEIIHACDFDTVLPAMVMKIFWKKIVIYDIFDFYADHLRKTPKFLKELIRRLDFWTINHADGVILVDDSRRAQIKGSHPKLSVSVYNSPEDFKFPVSDEQTPAMKSSLRIAYIGLLQVERGIFELVEVLKDHPNWLLDLAGFGGDEQIIVQSAMGMNNIHWHGRISYERALELSYAADVLIATYDPTIPNHRYSSPNKVFEAMMLGKPIIVAKNTNMDIIIENANCGLIIEYGSKRELEKALLLLEQDIPLREKYGENARRAYDETYSWRNMENRLIDFYDQVLDNRKA
jgi:glycosyltransferase involved in cell wall biosynthesis